MSKKILHKFKMDEISGVDRMAQVPAKMLLMKRDNDLAKGAFKDALFVMEVEQVINEAYWALWESDDVIRQAIQNILDNPTKYPNPQAAIIEAMGEYSEKVQEQAAEAAAAVPSKGVEKSAPDDPANKSDHSDGDGDNPLNPEEENMSKKPDEITVESLTNDLKGVNVELAKAESFGKFNDAEKAHYADLDETGQDDFMKMDEGARTNVLEKATEADSVIYTSPEGEEFRKSDDPRLVKMAQDRDSDRKLAKADRERAENLLLTKRADDELTNLPGEAPVKVALLKAVDGIEDESIRKSIGELLKAGNDSQAAAFDSNGTSEGSLGTAATELSTMTKAYAEEHKVSEAEAMTEVLKTDKGEALYGETQKP